MTPDSKGYPTDTRLQLMARVACWHWSFDPYKDAENRKENLRERNKARAEKRLRVRAEILANL